MDKKHLHITGICGVLTGALACAFKEAGWKVTGSDKGFFPPVSTELEKHGIEFYAGWHPEKMMQYGKPDLIIAATASGSKNPESIYLRENGIPTISSTEAIRDHLVRENSIVVCGTWGKTSSSALLSHILIEAGLNPSYMFGGISLSHDMAAKIRQGKWSVLEGDEYRSSPDDPTAKFFYYQPNHLLLTAISWDHADLYPTEQNYFDTFSKLITETRNKIKQTGIGVIVACGDNQTLTELIRKDAGTPGSNSIVFYGKQNSANNESCMYAYSDIETSDKGLKFVITKKDSKERFQINSPLLATFNVENITGCFAMASQIGIEPEVIIRAIQNFKGLKRRLERRIEANDNSRRITVIDDIAHSPEKAKYILENIEEIYKSKPIVIFEPNIGGRQRESAYKYDEVFNAANHVYIPRLTKLKIAEGENEAPMEGQELADTIQKTQPNTTYIDDDSKLVEQILNQTKDGGVIAFLGSHGFRGMIEEVVSRLKN